MIIIIFEQCDVANSYYVNCTHACACGVCALGALVLFLFFCFVLKVSSSLCWRTGADELALSISCVGCNLNII